MENQTEKQAFSNFKFEIGKKVKLKTDEYSSYLIVERSLSETLEGCYNKHYSVLGRESSLKIPEAIILDYDDKTK